MTCTNAVHRIKHIASLRQRGIMTLQLVVFGGIAIIFLSGFVVWADALVRSVIRASDRATAFTVAEAGIEYYRWHLAHASQDYWDGNGSSTPGPYAHPYYDKNGVQIGQFLLEITPPPSGSTVVTVKSTGRVLSDVLIKKIIMVRLGVPSFAKYAAAVHENVRFGQGTEIFGPVHSNGGVRMDGIAHNVVTSALPSYDDPDHTGAVEFGVHTHVNPPPGSGINDSFRPQEAPPTSPVPTRSDVFLVGRQLSVPALDFAGVTQDLSEIRGSAIAKGFYASSSGAQGYEVVFKTNDTFDLFRVNSTTTPPSGCYNSQSQDGWGTWSINTKTLRGTYPIPANGLIFIEDNVWVKGTINSARVTVASARFPDAPATRSSITVNENLLYTNYDGQDVIGLIAQKNINIGLVSSSTLRVDAALIAQNGRVGRYYYLSPTRFSNRCSPHHVKTQITTYGMIASNQRYGFAYTDGTGYQLRNLIYDSHLLYGPPPSFPLTSDTYEMISWDEMQ